MGKSLAWAGWWTRYRLLALLVAAVAGMAIGGLAYYASRLSGVALYVITGGVTAALGAVIWAWLTKSAAVSEVEVTVPQFSKVKFAVTKDHKVMARRIVVQMATRVAVQPLDDDAGRVDEAVASLHSLFRFVRELLDEDAGARPTPGRPNVDVLAMNMLTCHLRPFLSTWHRRYSDWRAANPGQPESEWSDDKAFRTELRDLQAQLRPQAIAFAKMAEYDGYLDVIGLAE
ncbi:hypothetical protein [Amycolatopsis alkalitolerans]|uniref:Uncharacterized protein n=1 Tax=Amycolatopsis alkalitolerans TaxID=2547244 RepID=A0A5C4M4X5_9PSEU|nr:hypothetical protein [Amycolatopsis alkalitolerans]TNC27694.1 hypothetical protein FG385_08195 [Amycolatopsis alkalitolerans]